MFSVLLLHLGRGPHTFPSFFAKLLAGLLLLAFCATVASTRAATLTNGDPAALSAAIQAGGEVTLAFDGTVKLPDILTITRETIVDATGHTVTLDGGNVTRHFAVASGATLRLINLQLSNGRFQGADGGTNEPGMAGCGGSIFNDGGILELIGCAFAHNEAAGGNGGPKRTDDTPGHAMTGGAAYGGAVYSVKGRLAITNCVFAGNQALGGRGEHADIYAGGGGDSFGGALYSTNGQTVLSGVVFTNNVARGGEPKGLRAEFGGGGAYGGAVGDEDETVTISDCRFAGNQTLGGTKVASDKSRETGIAKGGGVFHGKGAMRITDTLFETNSATGGFGWERGMALSIYGDGQGGAICNGADLHIENSTFASNQASGGDAIVCCPERFDVAWAGVGKGGGIFNDGRLSMVNCTLVDNTARGGLGDTVSPSEPGAAYGGGLFVQSGTVNLLNLTLAKNRAESSKEALAASIAVAQGSAICTNTILSCVPGQINVSGPLIDGGHNICSDASAAFSSPSSRNALDPRLGELGNYGGTTPVIPLLPDSPAIDSGDDSASPATDQRGMPRPKGLVSDIGAFELAPRIGLSLATDGRLIVEYAFKANVTNRVSASTNLVDWLSIGTKVADPAGNVELERVSVLDFLERFYRVEIQREP